MTEDDVLAFVRRAIRSSWALDTLVLVRRERQRAWSAEALLQELRASPALITESLAMLEAAGLIARTEGDRYAFSPRCAELAEISDALVELYAQKPIAVLRTIFTSPHDKSRSFSDAFLFKK